MEEDTRHFNDIHKSAHPQEGVCLYPPAMFDCSKSASLNCVPSKEIYAIHHLLDCLQTFFLWGSIARNREVCVTADGVVGEGED